jgi:hypothetical protein
MKHMIIETISSFYRLSRIQSKRFLAVVLGGMLLLSTNVDIGHRSSEALGAIINERIHQDDSQRPRTTREWREEARETEGLPGKRLQRIGKESAEAFKEFGSGYVEGAKETARDVGEGAKQVGKELSGKG